MKQEDVDTGDTDYQLLQENDVNVNTEREITQTSTSNQQYTSLNSISNPRHRGKQPSYQSLASDFTHITRRSTHELQSSQLKYAEVASVISRYSSFVPSKQINLIQIEYEVTEKTEKLSSRILYISVMLLFTIFYILLFPSATAPVAEYGVLILSLALSLLYTVLPSCVKVPIPCFCQTTDDADAYANKKKQETFIVTVKKLRVPLDESTVPVFCVLILIISGNPNFAIEHAWAAVKGNEIRPWQVLGVLFGLCYLCISLDLTGVLQALAKKTANLAEPSAKKLYFYIFCFAAVVTVFTNNDISIICLTPLVIQTANAGNMDSEPFIFLVLFASNTFSMLLVTGNPANLIVSESAGLEYLTYAQYMFIPTLITGAVLYAQLYFVFGKKLQTFTIPESEKEQDWKESIKLPRYSIFCIVRLLVASLLIPILGEIDGLDFPDMIAVLGIAIPSLVIDLMAFDIRRLAQFSSEEMDTESLLQIASSKHNASHQIVSALPKIDETDDEFDYRGAGDYINPAEMELSARMPSTTQSKAPSQMTNMTRQTHATFNTYDPNHLLYDLGKQKIITFGLDALWEMPWKLIPFVLSLFILVEYMNQIGFVDFLAHALADMAGGSEWAAMLIVGFAAAFLCQCVNNQPMTVLISTVLSACSSKGNQLFVKDNCNTNDQVVSAAYFALAIGANLGGNGTPIASLAVLMWKGILEKWGLFVNYIEFSKRGLCVTPLVVLTCVVCVSIEWQYIFPKPDSEDC